MRNNNTIIETEIIEEGTDANDILVQVDMSNGDTYEVDMATMEVAYEPVENWTE